jgi:hypothetical protein
VRTTITPEPGKVKRAFIRSRRRPAGPFIDPCN